MILNLGCGDDKFGDVRVDLYKTKTSTMEFDCDKPFPLMDESFSRVISRNLFEHLKNPNFFLKECYRVIKFGGLLYILTDNAGYWRYHYKGIFGSSAHTGYIGKYGNDDKHYALYNLHHLNNHLKSAGFKVISSYFLSPTNNLKSFERFPTKKVDRFLIHFIGESMMMTHICIESVKIDMRKL